MKQDLAMPRPYHHGTLSKTALDVAVARLRHGDEALPSLREIAVEIGVTHRALYRYFADKNAFKAAVAGEGFERLAKAMLCNDDISPKVVMAAYVRFGLSEPALYKLMFSLGSNLLLHEAAPGPSVRRVLAIATNAFTETHGSISIRDKVVSAWGMAHGLIDLWHNGALRALDLERAFDFIMSRLAASNLI
jgi:AcrR family transcriptional regulator